MIFDQSRHQILNSMTWDKGQAHEAVKEIFYTALNFIKDPPNLNEHANPPPYKSIYLGTSGIIWGLIEIGEFLGLKLPFDPIPLAEKIHENYLVNPDTGSKTPSFLPGEAGILLLLYKLTKDPSVKKRIIDLIESNFENKAHEMFFGSPGTMLVALHLDEPELFRNGADLLFESWRKDSNDLWFWDQNLEHENFQMIGAAHGFFGNIHALLKGKELLSQDQYEKLLSRTAPTTIKSSTRVDDMVNWPTSFNKQEEMQRVQWCHGAPGIIVSLGSFPKSYSREMEETLLMAGELIWHSGPLKKGIGLCHGTDGNGYAFLKLYQRTGDLKWLDRARQFAIFGLTQKDSEMSLWRGQIGLALYLISCIKSSSDFPCLDYF